MTIKLSWPVYQSAPITQRYGENPGGYTKGCTPDGSHNGLDFGIPEGTPIYAAAGGVVIRAGMDSTGYGLHVRLQHEGFATIYGHLRSTAVKAGQQVKAGQVIGESGNTGNSTGPHLHFEVRTVADKCTSTVDPLPYLQQAGANLIHGTVTAAGNGLRTRTEPNLSGIVRGYLPAGAGVDLIEIRDGWGKLYGAGERWVCLQADGETLVQLDLPTSDHEMLLKLWAAHPELH